MEDKNKDNQHWKATDSDEKKAVIPHSDSDNEKDSDDNMEEKFIIDSDDPDDFDEGDYEDVDDNIQEK